MMAKPLVTTEVQPALRICQHKGCSLPTTKVSIHIITFGDGTQALLVAQTCDEHAKSLKEQLGREYQTWPSRYRLLPEEVKDEG